LPLGVCPLCLTFLETGQFRNVFSLCASLPAGMIRLHPTLPVSRTHLAHLFAVAAGEVAFAAHPLAAIDSRSATPKNHLYFLLGSVCLLNEAWVSLCLEATWSQAASHDFWHGNLESLRFGAGACDRRSRSASCGAVRELQLNLRLPGWALRTSGSSAADPPLHPVPHLLARGIRRASRFRLVNPHLTLPPEPSVQKVTVTSSLDQPLLVHIK